MVLDIPPLTRPTAAAFTASGDLRDTFALSSRRDPLRPSFSPETSSDLPDDMVDWSQAARQDQSGSLRRTEWQQRSAGAPGAFAAPRSWDQSRPLYNPRGAPSDASPALTKLEARVSSEPTYVHHYASTRYASVSYLPVLLAEKRQRYDLFA
jgi:hypothetical protein